METPGGDYFELSLGRRRSIPPQLQREVAATECIDRRAIWPRDAAIDEIALLSERL